MLIIIIVMLIIIIVMLIIIIITIIIKVMLIILANLLTTDNRNRPKPPRPIWCLSFAGSSRAAPDSMSLRIWPTACFRAFGFWRLRV